MPKFYFNSLMRKQCVEEEVVYSSIWLEEKMWSKITKLDTKLVIFLQGNKTVTYSIIFCLKRKSFLSLQEKIIYTTIGLKAFVS